MRPGWIPPQMSLAVTAASVRRGRRCFLPAAATTFLSSHTSHFPRHHVNIDGRAHPDTAMKRFADLSEQEILALAITNEEEDSRIYQGFGEGLGAQSPS